ncbi:MAG: porin family protein [Gammaproteobacteria bacterium]|nr:porin family protein [Gammaproteobacteria bacterium]
MSKYNNLLFSTIISFFWVCASYASPWHSQDIRQNFVFSIAGGPTWASPGQSQELYIDQNTTNYYLSNGDITNKLATGELFFGIYQDLNDATQGQIGIELGYSGNTYTSGTILQNADPQKEYYSYSYNMRQFRTSVKGKLVFDDLPVTSYVQPYIGGSLGVGFNHAYGFKTTKLNAQADSTPQFTPKTIYAFTYTIGGGLQIPIDPFWQIGIGYELAGWGKNQLGKSTYQQEDQAHGLEIQNIYTNTALVTLSYTS